MIYPILICELCGAHDFVCFSFVFISLEVNREKAMIRDIEFRELEHFSCNFSKSATKFTK